MKLRDERGSIMLETVLILPIFVLIIFFIIQITFVWTAKQMTYYAAYCGARAALVYNPADYHAVKQKDGSWKTEGFIRKGIVHHAACAVLSWISWSIGGYDLSQGMGLFHLTDSAVNELLNFRISTYLVPLSSNVRNQVSVNVSEFEKIESEKKEENNNNSGEEEPAAIHEQFPAVTVTVAFKCPLFIPLGGPVVAYFFGANDQVCIPTYETQKIIVEKNGECVVDTVITKDSIGIGGFTAYNGDLVHARLQAGGNYTESNGRSYYSIVLKESCTMAKPYKTDTYPLMPKIDKTFMGMVD